MAKIELDIKIVQGRITLVGKTYQELNPDEKKVMDGLIKDKKLETETL